jgi:hypothetical protein
MSPMVSRSPRASLMVAVLCAASVVAACSGTGTVNTGDGGPVGSSGSSSGGTKIGGSAKVSTCTNTNLNHARTSADDVCDACDLMKCGAESDAALGSDPSVFGGVCGTLVQCECDCSAADKACNSACVAAETAACKSALSAVINCQQTKCATECTK